MSIPPNQSDDGCLFPFRSEDHRVQFRSGQKGQYDGPGAGEEGYPVRFCVQAPRNENRADYQLRHGANHNFRERRRNLEPNRKQCGDESQTHPNRRLYPNVFRGNLSSGCRQDRADRHDSATRSVSGVIVCPGKRWDSGYRANSLAKAKCSTAECKVNFSGVEPAVSAFRAAEVVRLAYSAILAISGCAWQGSLFSRDGGSGALSPVSGAPLLELTTAVQWRREERRASAGIGPHRSR